MGFVKPTKVGTYSNYKQFVRDFGLQEELKEELNISIEEENIEMDEYEIIKTLLDTLHKDYWIRYSNKPIQYKIYTLDE